MGARVCNTHTTSPHTHALTYLWVYTGQEKSPARYLCPGVVTSRPERRSAQKNAITEPPREIVLHSHDSSFYFLCFLPDSGICGRRSKSILGVNKGRNSTTWRQSEPLIENNKCLENKWLPSVISAWTLKWLVSCPPRSSLAIDKRGSDSILVTTSCLICSYTTTSPLWFHAVSFCCFSLLFLCEDTFRLFLSGIAFAVSPFLHFLFSFRGEQNRFRNFVTVRKRGNNGSGKLDGKREGNE